MLLSSPFTSQRTAGHELVLSLPPQNLAALLHTDADLLGLSLLSLLLPPSPVPDILRGPLYPVLVTSLLQQHKTAPPALVPLPASVSFAAAALCLSHHHVYAGALLAEACDVHPSLRSVEGVLSLLWSRLRKGEERGTDKGWGSFGQVREAALAALEGDERW